MSVAAASLMGIGWMHDPHVVMAPLALVLGAIAISGAWRWRPAALPSRAALLPAMLAVATAITWLAAGLVASNLLALHRLAVTNPAAIIAPVALGGALWRLYSTRRRLALAAWTLALVPAAIASPAFVQHVVRDPLIAPMEAFVERTAILTPIASGSAPDPRSTSA